MGKQNIVIIGGGSAGVAAAKTLSKALDPSKYQVIVINPLPYRIWLIATLRLAVTQDEALKNDIFLPYDKVFVNGNGKFVQGKVASFTHSKEGGIVTLESGEKIDYHILLLSQGATWNGPPAFPSTEDGVKDHLNNFHSKVSKAQDIVLVGGGAVGMELAGEIKDVWPEKKVTIVHGDKLLLNPSYPDKFRRAAADSLTARGINLVLDEFINDPETREVQGITTASGKELKGADLITQIQTRGPRPNTTFVSEALGESSLTSLGLIRVRPTLQLADYDNIFAAGDAIDWKEQKQSAKASLHGDLVAKNIVALLSQKPLKPYKGMFEMICLTNGKDSGIAYFDVLWGITLGAWFARMVKSRSLLVSLYKGSQGY
ncbi:hypothetical protein H0H93_007320 [Arthromyces matolae]|nr:hypothetical protein H0H93_007320 [Arthromyces matolae]